MFGNISAIVFICLGIWGIVVIVRQLSLTTQKSNASMRCPSCGAVVRETPGNALSAGTLEDMLGNKKSAKKGYWTQKTHLLRADEYICSCCGRSANKAYKQCPSCGAAMGKSKYDPSWVDEPEY